MKNTRNQAQQTQLFQQGEDLPLFSGVAPKADVDPFRPKPYTRQLPLFELSQGSQETASNER